MSTPPDARKAVATLVGAWRLEGFTVTGEDGAVSQPLGPRPHGQISYGADGHMSAHLMKGEGAHGPTPMSDYSAYFGRFSIDAARQVVTHHVEGASFGSLIGVDQPRGYRFKDDLLILSASLSEGRAELAWRRLVPKPEFPA